MNRPSVHIPLAALLLCALVPLLGGCGSGDDAAVRKLPIELTDEGCNPHDATVPAGSVAFEAENSSSDNRGKLAVLEGEDTLGEVGEIAKGRSDSFSLSLEKGDYTLRCSGSNTDGTLTVTNDAPAPTSQEANAVVSSYRSYLEKSANELVVSATPFTAVVAADKVHKSKALYPEAHALYERMAPAFGSFGSLDHRIDGLNPRSAVDPNGGFHQIEKTLWYYGTVAGMAPTANRLLDNIEELAKEVGSASMRPVQISTGSWELLRPISTSKLGWKAPYSHLELADIEANVEGAHATFAAVKPLFAKRNPTLVKKIEASFENAYAALRPYVPVKPYRHGDRLVPSTKLSEAEARKLALAIGALSGELAQVPAQISG